MNKVFVAFLSALIWITVYGAVYAEGKLPFDLKPTCNASLEGGKIVRGHDKNVGDFKDVWMAKTIIGFGVQAILRATDTLRVAAEMKMFNEYPRTAVEFRNIFTNRSHDKFVLIKACLN